MSQINYFFTFSPLKVGAKAPDNHLFVSVHVCFYVKFYIIRTAILVARGNMKVSICEDSLCGLVNLYNARKYFFLGNIKKLNVDSVYVVNNYLPGFKK